jgi:hypothetical protein
MSDMIAKRPLQAIGLRPGNPVYAPFKLGTMLSDQRK